jgi:hypothetical protein
MKLRVSSFVVSIDGYGAGPNQDLQNPIGVGGTALMDWFFPVGSLHYRYTSRRCPIFTTVTR